MAEHEKVNAATEETAAPLRILEQDVPLSRSLIWRAQRDFYATRALKVWTEDQVPSYITNNPFIADIYAELIAAFLDDCGSLKPAPPSRETPVRILELGAGTGKFAYLLLRRLTGLLKMRDLPLDSFQYVMTECSESVLEDWHKNPYLAEFVSQGMLHFGTFSAGLDRDQQPNAWIVNKARGTLIVIANYVFDSLPQDAFAVDRGQLGEILVTTSAEGDDHNLRDLKFSFAKSTVSSNHYSDPCWTSILEQYQTSLPAATVLFPTTTLTTLQRLSETSDGRMLVLAADKGISHEADLTFLQGEPTLEFHASRQCFSQLVNFDAIAKYFRSKGGDALLPQKHFTSLNLCGFLQHLSGEGFPATRRAYHRAIDGCGPDDLFAVMMWLNDHLDQVPLDQAISLLRLTRWDPTAFARLFPAIARQARNAGPERNDLRDAILKTWGNHYPLFRQENILAFYCGAVLLEMRFFSEAYEMFRKSQQLFEPSAATSFNLGLCCQGMNRLQEAMEFMCEACSLDPGFEPARQSRLKLEDQLSRMKPDLRPVNPDDREFLFRLYSSTRSHEIAPLGWPAAQQQVFLRMQFNAQQQWYQTVYAAAEHQIIELAGQPIGRMIVLREQGGWHLVDISLLSEHRGHGIGGGLMRSLIHECATAGVILKLQVLKLNPALRLYQRLGFTITGEDQMYMQMQLDPQAVSSKT
jgi:GNAT superfamily N-acetyltransferase